MSVGLYHCGLYDVTVVSHNFSTRVFLRESKLFKFDEVFSFTKVTVGFYVSCFFDVGIDDISMLAWNSSFTKKHRGWRPPKETWQHYQDGWKATYTLGSQVTTKKLSIINAPGGADKPLKHCFKSLDWLSVKWYIFVYKTWKSSNNIYIWFPYISCTVQGGP